MKIEFELNTIEQTLLGIYFMNATAENQINGDLRDVKCIQLGFLFFTISIFLD